MQYGAEMIREPILKQVLVEQRELVKPLPEHIERELVREISSLVSLKHIVTVTGHRRAGKSVFLSQIIERYYGIDNVYYLNLDDERLASLSLEDMNSVMEAFFSLFGKRRVIFLDEIQNLSGWERFISRLYNQGYKIYITGSNANLLSSELATVLTGRYVEAKIYPFSFREFLMYRGVKVDDERVLYKTEVKGEIRKLFDEYLLMGGFPEVVRYKELDLLRLLFSDVITKDIVARYEIREAKTIKEIAHFLVSNPAKEFSYNRIKNIYGLGSVHTVKNYIDYLVSAYMFFELPKCSYSLKEMHTRTKKCYVIDNGFVSAVGFSATQDIGRLYENLVFGELKRRGKEVYYYKDRHGREVDFVVRGKKNIEECIQVCFDVEDEKTFHREVRSLLSAMKELKVGKGLILTANDEDVIKADEKEIILIPTWKWCLRIPVFPRRR